MVREAAHFPKHEASAKNLNMRELEFIDYLIKDELRKAHLYENENESYIADLTRESSINEIGSNLTTNQIRNLMNAVNTIQEVRDALEKAALKLQKLSEFKIQEGKK